MEKYTPRLLNMYNEKIKKNLQNKLTIKNAMKVPKLEKIVLNMGIGDGKDNKTTMKQAIEEMKLISVQKPIVTKSKKAISNFKIRIGDPVGISVTLRRKYMYEFFDRFISVTSPRIRDFRGFSSKGFDGNGNYNFGITEQIIFPEIDYDKVNSIRGMNITVVTTADSDYESYQLLKHLGFPINELKRKKNLIDMDDKNKTRENKKNVTDNDENINSEEVVVETDSNTTDVSSKEEN